MERDAILAFVTAGQIAGIAGRVASSWWPRRWRETGLAVAQVATFSAIVTLGLVPNSHTWKFFTPTMATLNAVSAFVQLYSFRTLLFSSSTPLGCTRHGLSL